ncbi:hypothetical protein R4K55_08240 [Brachyspira alvinipulli]|uniref:hypothetical protein n=1 Tax=Brachyspira alvinipulli TaxID=84379 RepID=UPI003005A01D
MENINITITEIKNPDNYSLINKKYQNNNTSIITILCLQSLSALQKLIKVYYNISTNKLNITHKYSNSYNSKISISNNVYNKNLLKRVQIMKKKILSIFVMVTALSLLGIGCNKKITDPTNEGGTIEENTKAINAALNGLGKIYISGSVVSSPDIIISNEYDFTIIAADSTGTSHSINGRKRGLPVTDIDILLEQIKKIEGSGITVTVDTRPNGKPDPLILTVKKNNAVVTLTIRPSSNGWSFN